MQTAALAIALEQGAVVSVEEKAGELYPPLIAHLCQQIFQFLRIARQVAHIDADRQLVVLTLHRDNQLGQQIDRQVVHTVVTQIFQHSQGYRFTGARTSTYHD